MSVTIAFVSLSLLAVPSAGQQDYYTTIEDVWLDDFIIDPNLNETWYPEYVTLRLGQYWHLHNDWNWSTDATQNKDLNLFNPIIEGDEGRLYHGPFTQLNDVVSLSNVVEGNLNFLTRHFRCAHNSDVYLSFSFGFCETGSDDYVRVYNLQRRMSKATPGGSDLSELEFLKYDMNMNSASNEAFPDDLAFAAALSSAVDDSISSCSNIANWRKRDVSSLFMQRVSNGQTIILQLEQSLSRQDIEFGVIWNVSLECRALSDTQITTPVGTKIYSIDGPYDLTEADVNTPDLYTYWNADFEIEYDIVMRTPVSNPSGITHQIFKIGAPHDYLWRYPMILVFQRTGNRNPGSQITVWSMAYTNTVPLQGKAFYPFTYLFDEQIHVYMRFNASYMFAEVNGVIVESLSFAPLPEPSTIPPETELYPVYIGGDNQRPSVNATISNFAFYFVDPVLTKDPTPAPTVNPTQPSVMPTADPTTSPTVMPTAVPSEPPTRDPSTSPSTDPSSQPSLEPATETTSFESATAHANDTNINTTEHEPNTLLTTIAVSEIRINFSISIVTADLNITQIRDLFILAFNVSNDSASILQTNVEDDGHVTVILTVVANVNLTTDVIQTIIEREVHEKYGEDIDFNVVKVSEYKPSSTETAAESVNVTVLVMAICSGVFVVCIVVAGIMWSVNYRNMKQKLRQNEERVANEPQQRQPQPQAPPPPLQPAQPGAVALVAVAHDKGAQDGSGTGFGTRYDRDLQLLSVGSAAKEPPSQAHLLDTAGEREQVVGVVADVERKQSEEVVELQMAGKEKFVYDPDMNYKPEGARASVATPGMNPEAPQDVDNNAANRTQQQTNTDVAIGDDDVGDDDDAEDMYVDMNEPQTTTKNAGDDKDDKQDANAKTLFM